MSMLARLANMGGASTAITQIGSVTKAAGTGTSIVLSTPTGVQEGDLLIIFAYSTGASNTYTANGWSVVSFGSSASVLYRIVDTNLPSSTTVTVSGSNAYSAVCVAYRNAVIDLVGTASTAVAAPAAPAITLTANASTVLAVYWQNATSCTYTTPSGYTALSSDSDATAPSWALFAKANVAAGSTGTVSSTGSTGSSSKGALIGLKNATYKAIPFIASAKTQNSATGATLVINKPDGTQEGDIMIAFMATDGNSNGTWTGDTAWTEIAEQTTGTKPNARVAYKVAGASEGSSYTFTNSASSMKLGGAIVTYRAAAFDAIGSFGGAGSAVTATGPSAAADYSRLVGFGVDDDVSATITTTMLMNRVIDNDVNGPSFVIADDIVKSGATGTRTFTMPSSGNNTAILLTIKPA